MKTFLKFLIAMALIGILCVLAEMVALQHGYTFIESEVGRPYISTPSGNVFLAPSNAEPVSQPTQPFDYKAAAQAEIARQQAAIKAAQAQAAQAQAASLTEAQAAYKAALKQFLGHKAKAVEEFEVDYNNLEAYNEALEFINAHSDDTWFGFNDYESEPRIEAAETALANAQLANEPDSVISEIESELKAAHHYQLKVAQFSHNYQAQLEEEFESRFKGKISESSYQKFVNSIYGDN